MLDILSCQIFIWKNKGQNDILNVKGDVRCLNYFIRQMKSFEDRLKDKAHMSKIKQAKTTIMNSTRHSSKLISSKVGVEAQLLLQLFDKKNYDSIPAYKLLRTSGLQQYTRVFIQMGYGINLGRLALIKDQQKKKLYEDLKILPGHTIKLDKIIETLAKSSYSLNGNESYDVESSMGQKYTQLSPSKLKILTKKDTDYERQLERVLNEYTPQNDQKKKTFNSKYSDKKIPISTQKNHNQTKYAKTKYSLPGSKDPNSNFKKKPFEPSTKPTVKKSVQTADNSKKQSLPRMLRSVDNKSQPMSSKKVMEINLQIDKIKSVNRSFDGALMTSTIANIDLEELIYAFSGFVASKVVVAPQPITYFQRNQREARDLQDQDQDIEDEVGQILKESFLHPLYKQDEVEEDLPCEQETYSEGQEDEPTPTSHKNNQFLQDKMMESSFLEGGVSVDFGFSQPLKIFQEPEPTTIDYFKPTVDSVSNFIKNIVLTAKMERQIPIMAAAYLQNFTKKAKLALTSLNYKRVLVTVLLLASKIWDDQSFQTPSFSKTFPIYSTVLLNEMQKQVVKALDYRLKIDKKEYTKIYFQLRRFTKENVKSYQNRRLTLMRIRELQKGVRKDFKSYFMTKRNSY